MESEIKEGYLYAFSNTCMPGILKVGMTERTPEERLRDANRSDTWRPPAPYKLECAIKVNNPLKKENIQKALFEFTKDNNKASMMADFILKSRETKERQSIRRIKEKRPK